MMKEYLKDLAMIKAENLIREKALALYGYDVSKGKLFNRKSGRIVIGFKRKDGYMGVTIRLKDKKYSIFYHRVVWLIVHGTYPKYTIDHINGIRTDNRIDNLRDVTFKCNCQNRHVRNTKTGFIGIHIIAVRKSPQKRYYYYCVKYNNKNYFFGKDLFKAVMFRCIHNLNV